MKNLTILLPVVYLLVCGYLILTQGLFGESFIALILGMPWALLPAFFEFGGTDSTTMVTLFLLAPIALNAYLLYLIGAFIGNRFTRTGE